MFWYESFLTLGRLHNYLTNVFKNMTFKLTQTQMHSPQQVNNGQAQSDANVDYLSHYSIYAMEIMEDLLLSKPGRFLFSLTNIVVLDSVRPPTRQKILGKYYNGRRETALAEALMERYICNVL